MAELPNDTIDKFQLNNGLPSEGWLALRNMDNLITERISYKMFGVPQQSQNFSWDSTNEYNEGEFVTNGGLGWVSNYDNNLNITPGTNPGNLDPAPWSPQAISPSGFTPWQAGAFTQDLVTVLNQYDGYTQLFLLKNPARPFISSNFLLEFSGGEWEIMSERGYLPVIKAAHGFAVGMNLTYDAVDGWIPCTGTTPALGMVKTVVNTERFILLLYGARVKELVGLTPGTTYYVQPDGSTGDDSSLKMIMVAISATEAILFTAGGSGGSTGGGGGTTNSTGRYLAFRFDSDLFIEQSLAIRGLISNVSGTATQDLSGVSFAVRLDTDPIYTPLVNLAAVQTWVDTNISGDEFTGDIWWLKVIGVVGGFSEYLLVFDTGDGITPPPVTSDYRQESFRFPSDTMEQQEMAFRGLISELSSSLTDELDTVLYYTRLDADIFDISMNLAGVQAWITANVVGDDISGTIFWIRCLAIYKAGRNNEAENMFKYKIG